MEIKEFKDLMNKYLNEVDIDALDREEEINLTKLKRIIDLMEEDVIIKVPERNVYTSNINLKALLYNIEKYDIIKLSEV